jgi:predicted CXXCH cytochrome family protein
MVALQLLLITLFFILFAMPVEGRENTLSSAQGNILTLLYPPDKSVMEFGPLSISLKIGKGFPGKIKVLLNGNETKEIVPDSEFECFSLPLAPGINTVLITAIRSDTESERISFTVFLRSELEGIYKKPPAEYKKNHFHMGEHPQCIKCHVLTPNEYDKKPIPISVFIADALGGIKKSSAQASTCSSCHRGIISYRYIHGPSSVWGCLSCHNYQAMPVYSTEKPEAEKCFSCHTEQKKNWGSKKNIHGPVTIGKCTICHNPHASENPYTLFKPSWDICVSCHAGKATGRHIFVGFSYQEGHPTRDRPDPIREGKELSCASCHNPHASDYQHLWSLEAETQFELCQKCHKY